MAKKKQRTRIYWREQGGVQRAYGDFRDAGGGREALIPAGDKRATTDPVIAEKLAGARLAELQAAKRDLNLFGLRRGVTLRQLAEDHLVQKAKSGEVTEGHIENTEACLRVDLAFLEGLGRTEPATVTVDDVQKLVAWLREQPNGRGGTLSSSTVRHYLMALSNLYRRAEEKSLVTPGFNPVRALMDKPKQRHEEARWLEVHEAALLLEAARTHQPEYRRGMLPFMYPLLSTFLLTGGRMSEVFGLQAEDISFDRNTITFRPNNWRRLKTRTSWRTIPLWPQLREAMQDYMYGGSAPRVTGLLFPSARGTGMTIDIRKALDAIAVRAGWGTGDIRTKMFRHTYCAARLQTLDQGEPVSIFTVGKELGHGGDSLVRRVYGHLGQTRHRAAVVEYRVDVNSTIADERVRQAFANRLRAISRAA